MAVKTEDKRAAILSAALDYFEERGLCRHQMEDIARSAGVAKGRSTLLQRAGGTPARAAKGIAGVMHHNLENVTSSENEGLPLKDRLMKVVAPLSARRARSATCAFPTRLGRGPALAEIMRPLRGGSSCLSSEMTAFLPACSRRRTSPTSYPTVPSSSSRRSSVDLHPRARGQRAHRLAREMHQRLRRLHPLEERTRGARPPTFACPAKTPDERPSASFGVGRRPPASHKASLPQRLDVRH